MRVFCENCDCIYEKGGECSREHITVGDLYDSGCSVFEDYIFTEEYNNQYYKAVRTIDNKIAKAKVIHGKRIEYKGYVFYTVDKVTDNRDYFVTEEKTGFWAGSFEKLQDENRWNLFVKKAKEIPNVDTLPLAVWEPGGYVILDKGDVE